MTRFIEGVDYFVQFMAFPNMASPIFTALNDDGTFTIVLNTRFSREVLAVEMRHELEHIADDHFFDARPVAYLEAEADGSPLREPPPPRTKTIPLFQSAQALADWVLRPRNL